MRIEQLQYLVEVAQTNSFRIAAENLYVTQPAISEGIKKLEQELGVILLERSQSGVFVTEIGAKIVASAKKALGDLADLTAQAQSYHYRSTTLAGELIIYTRPAIDEVYMPPLIDLVRQQQPELRLTVFERNVWAIFDNLHSGQGDFGLFNMLTHDIATLRKERADLTFERIRELKLYLVVNDQTDLARKELIWLKDISKMAFALHSTDENDYAMIDTLIFKNTTKPIIAFRSDNMKHIFQRIEAESLVTILNGLRLAELPPGLKAIPIGDITDFGMWCCYSKTHPQQDKIAYLKHLLTIVAHD